MTIDPEKEYTLLEIVRLGILGKSHYTVSSAIWRDKHHSNMLKAKIVGTGKGNRYEILGSNLLKYLEMQNV